MSGDVVGTDAAIARLDPGRWARNTRAALEESGAEIAAGARGNLAGHSFTGRTASSIESRVDGEGLNLALRVGAITPEARTLEFGWRSSSGKQPPAEAIRGWLSEKGGDPADAWVVARAIGRRGFSFGALHWLGRAVDAVRPRVVSAIRAGIDR